MSELRVAEIHNPNDQTGGIEIDNNDVVSINGSPIGNQGALGNRNLIINGAMQIAQRGIINTGQTATAYRCCDRFRSAMTTLGTWTVQQLSKDDDAANAPDGFSESLRMLCTTADPTPAAGDACLINYFVEGFDCQRLLNTATTTHPLRLSFWVKAVADAETFPKTASVDLIQIDNADKMFSASYTIQASDTWQRVVIEIPADTAAAFDNDNGRGLQIDWWLNSGSDFNSGAHSAGWVAQDNTARNAENLGVGGTVDDEFCLTGVQLEVGTNATAFEWRPHGTELALCQRYFELKDDLIFTALGEYDQFIRGGQNFYVTKRFPPNVVISDASNSGGSAINLGLGTVSINGFTYQADSVAQSFGLKFNYTANAEL